MNKPPGAGAGAADVIVVGAGHNGLVAAATLQAAGMSTLVLEACAGVGGRTATIEPLLPGHRHNPHANYLMYQGVSSTLRDLDLEAYGLRTLVPEAQHGVVFDDGRPPVIIYRDDLTEATHASIARTSRTDADTWRDLAGRTARGRARLGTVMDEPPRFDALREHVAWVTHTYRDVLAAVRPRSRGTARGVIDATFESPALRTLMYRIAAELGVELTAPGTDIAFLSSVLPTLGGFRLPVGGMRSVAEALRRCCEDRGARVVPGMPVVEVLVERGRAVGVRTRAGDRIRANVAVLSSVGSDELTERAAGNPGRRAAPAPGETIIASAVLCLTAAPDYRSARWEPSANRCFQTFFGLDSPGEVLQHDREIHTGLLPVPAGAARINSLWDTDQAPRDRHTAGIDAVFPGSITDSGWDELAEAFANALVDRWTGYTEAMSPRDVIARRLLHPGRLPRSFVLREGTDQYRAGIDGLYRGDSSVYPGGGVHGAAGRLAAQVITRDTEPRKPR